MVEVQITVAVIALMAAIAVPHVCRITERAQTAKDKTNAENVSTMAAAAAAAGVVFSDVDSAVAQLTSGEGVVVTTGGLAGTRYHLGSLTESEVEGAKRYLRFAEGHLTVIP